MQPGEQIGPFLIEKPLGSGAMGTVFRARNSQTGQVVAIKVIAPGLTANPVLLQRFQRESAILRQLQHPNIVRLLAVGKYRGTPFYAMEYVAGESLDRVLARRGRLPWEEVLSLGRQLCAALQHVHERGIIHRDLKPSNVLLLADGTVKLTDFGIAKDLDETNLTATNCTVGTASYMSPEQCRGVRDLTPRSDLYSLGVMLYELLTGQKPFTADSPVDMFLKHLQEQPERPSRRALDIPVWLDTLILQLLEKEPIRRPASAAAVAEALERIQEKTLAMQSASLEAVRRSKEHPTASKLAEEDKEMARLLLGKKGKRKKRRRQAARLPLWVQALAGGAGLLVLLGLVFWLGLTWFRPPSPQELYDEARNLVSGTEEQRWQARQGPIAEYLKRYGARDDALTQEIRLWADEIDRSQRERQLHNRLRLGLPPDGVDAEAEIHARRGLEAEKEGDLARAVEEWQRVALWLQKSDRDLRAWGLVADKHLRDLDEAQKRYERLHSYVLREHLKPPDAPQKPIEKTAAAAIRAEEQKNWSQARDCWEQVQKLAEQQADQAGADEAGRRVQDDARCWLLLARGRLRDLSQLPLREKKTEKKGPSS
jgi:tetratricopeptide (TPR) repeat protein